MGLRWFCGTFDPGFFDEHGVAGWEPFAINHDGRVWAKREMQVEDDEPRSSTRHANRAGNEPDAAE